MAIAGLAQEEAQGRRCQPRGPVAGRQPCGEFDVGDAAAADGRESQWREPLGAAGVVGETGPGRKPCWAWSLP